MDQINRGIDDMVVTPSILPVVGKTRTSPSSTTKFIERSLHDLDDLIQQRRLELSALRKSNRKRLNDQFSVGGKTPLTKIKPTLASVSEFNTTRTTKLTSYIKTPKLDNFPEEDSQSWTTPIASQRTQKLVNINEEISEETTLNPIPMDLVEPPPVESYLAATKLTALESTIASLQRENEYLVEKCRVISLEKNKLEESKLAIEHSLSLANDNLAVIPLALSRPASPTKTTTGQVSDEDAMDIYNTASVRLNDDSSEKRELQEKIELLQASCLEWQNSSSMAAKSAFEWEAHCGTITSHFEGLLSEWQSANSALIDENESLKSAIETHNILPEVEVDDEEDDFMAEGPMKGIVDLKVVETVHPAAVESAVLAELKLKRTDAMIQIFNKRLQHQEKRYAQTKAFQIMKLNCYLQVQNKFYKLKCASYLQDKEAELRRQYNDRPKDPITPKKVSTPPASVPTDVVEKPPSVKTKSVNRVTSLIVLACGQAGLWLALLVIGHWYLRDTGIRPTDSLAYPIIEDFTLQSEL